MTTDPDKVLRGAVEPRIHTPLIGGKSRMQEVADLADMIEMPLLPFQRWVLDDFLQVDKDNQFQRKLAGLIIARQNGKTHLARMRILAGLFLFGEKNILGISSNRNMALDTFQNVAGAITDNDWMRKQVKAIRYANGSEKILLNNGAKYEIAAASRDGTRGKTVDFLFVDECREISQEGWTAARPTVRARPNSQTLTTSNAGDAFSEVLNDLREGALNYPPKTFAWYEYSAPDYCKLDDRKAWTQANPAMGYLFNEDAIEEAIATSTPEAARTEVLCQWVSSLASPFPPGSWEKCSVDGLKVPDGVPTIMAFDISPSRRYGSLVIGALVDDKIVVGLLQTWESQVAVDELKIAAEIKEWTKKYRPRMVCYDKYATQTIADRLFNSGGVMIQDVSGSAFYQACGDLLDSVINQRLQHGNQASLNMQINNVAAKQNDSAWRIVKRKSAGDVSAPIALAMIVHQLVKPQSSPNIVI